MDAAADLLKLGLLASWAAWFAVVFLTNTCGALKALGRLPDSWRFASRNYEAVVKATRRYCPPPWVPAFLFAGVLGWQLAVALLFAWAAIASVMGGSLHVPAADAAITGAIFLWLAFMLADEITLEYEFERTHELLLLSQFATLLVIHLLPAA